jgi:prolyl-tRNA synthetase
MRWSKSFIPTLRDDPADAEAASHRLLLRAGYVRQLGAGIYSILPLGQRVLTRIATILREEMTRIGAQEFHLPALHPSELWKESGRWDEIGDEMFRLRDRKQTELCLGMTHEEVFTAIARDELRSYRALPQTWYQIQSKFRDEPRHKAGVLRGRQFTMKDSYSFDVDEAGLDLSFDAHAEAYRRIFSRCGIEALPVQASSGAMGGSESVEFMALADVGEDWVVRCRGCGYAANLEKARSKLPEVEEPANPALPEKFPTPGVRTIEDLAAFPGGAPGDRQIKTLAYQMHGELALVLLRGDHTLNEVKLAEAAGTSELRPSQSDEIRARLGAHPGSLGAVGVTGLRIYADHALRGRSGMVTGANEDGAHLRHVDVNRDIADAHWCDLRAVEAGEACATCDKPLEVHRAIELGHIFKLGTRYSARLGATVLGQDGKEHPIVMGSYGIGLERLMAAVAESHHDTNGISWPASVAPYSVVISPPRMNDGAQAEAAEGLYDRMVHAGLDVLLDDRDERAGVKFKDADLIGIPYRIVPGPRALGRGCVELVTRADASMVEVPIGDVVDEVTRRLRAATAA